jgi:hypothetical protein
MEPGPTHVHIPLAVVQMTTRPYSSGTWQSFRRWWFRAGSVCREVWNSPTTSNDGTKINGLFICPSFHDSALSSTMSYIPFDSDAPRVFSETAENNYVKREWCLSYHVIHTGLTFDCKLHSWYAITGMIHITLKLTHGYSVDAGAVWSCYHSGQGGKIPATRSEINYILHD